ncbi:unnamed protein product [Rangifer tarandus platyrhynchus]|uniref:Uncharacterized protein n=1 Tax=Rangifer tarandus platyrhynchus TaxID=3082113 RepID=A0ABN8Z3W5_RANTA|nr:unnamed protein product [Rangifer tarandus platyrhynchus]
MGTTPASRTTEPVPPESVKPQLGAPRDTSSRGTTHRQGCSKPTQGPPVTLDLASPLTSAKRDSAEGTCSLLLFSGTLGPPSDQARLACRGGGEKWMMQLPPTPSQELAHPRDAREEAHRGPAASEFRRRGPPRPRHLPNTGARSTSAPHPPIRGGKTLHQDHTCSQNPVAPTQAASARSRSPGAPGAPDTLRRRQGHGAARTELPGSRGGMPGRKLPGKLEQLERASASLLHNSRAAEQGGPLTCLSRAPQPGWGSRRAEARHLAGARLDPRGPGVHPRLPGLRQVHRPRPRRARCSSRAHLDGGSGSRCGAGVADAGSPGTLRPRHGSPPPARPLAAPCQFHRQACGPRYPRQWAAT